MIVDEGGKVHELPDGHIVPRIWVEQRRILLDECDYVLDFEEMVYLDRGGCGRDEGIEVRAGVIGAEDSIEHCGVRHFGSGEIYPTTEGYGWWNLL
jgi:hypothetical protein